MMGHTCVFVVDLDMSSLDMSVCLLLSDGHELFFSLLYSISTSQSLVGLLRQPVNTNCERGMKLCI